jgi:formate dehydrogenase assembly factor FdhD
MVVDLPAVTASRPVWRVGGGGTTPASEWLAEEVPVALVYNGISHVVMLGHAVRPGGLRAGLLAHRRRGRVC